MFHELFILFVLNVSPALWVQLSWEVKVSVSPDVPTEQESHCLHCLNVRVQNELVA